MKLNLANDQICNGMIVEASAGTGKTYAVAALVADPVNSDLPLVVVKCGFVAAMPDVP